MTDPIKAALETATEAAMESIGWPDDGSMDFEPRDTCRDAAAAAIAAFLRALPDQYSRGGAAFWDAIPADEETRLWLAAAAERAAREGGG